MYLTDGFITEKSLEIAKCLTGSVTSVDVIKDARTGGNVVIDTHTSQTQLRSNILKNCGKWHNKKVQRAVTKNPVGNYAST